MTRRTTLKKIGSQPWLIAAMAALLLLAAAACGDGDATPEPAAPTATSQPAAPATATPEPPAPTATPEPPKLSVVTTSNIIGDWVMNIGGDQVEVYSLLPVAADPHTYKPGARDAARIAEADLVLSIGLGLEEAWLYEVVESAAKDESAVVELAALVDPIEFEGAHAEDEHAEDEHAEDEHGDHEEIMEGIAHVIHEVEDGHITAEQGIAELEELLEGVDAHDEEFAEILEILEEVDHGHMAAEAAIEAIEEHSAEDAHADEGHMEMDHDEILEGIDHVIHEVEDGHITAEEGIAELEELLEGVDAHDEEFAEILEILEEVDHGHMAAEAAIEAIEEHSVEGMAAHDDHGHMDAHGHDHGLEDPHFWFDPIRVMVAVDDITARLSALDPGRSAVFQANASAYKDTLDELHHWTEEQVATIPEERRLLVTSHDAFSYFAKLYHFRVVGLVLGTNPDMTPSPRDLADLIEVVKEHEVPAIFGETTVSERLAQAVASESGAELVRLYSGSLGAADGEAGTYEGMVRTNVMRITEALR